MEIYNYYLKVEFLSIGKRPERFSPANGFHLFERSDRQKTKFMKFTVSVPRTGFIYLKVRTWMHWRLSSRRFSPANGFHLFESYTCNHQGSG